MILALESSCDETALAIVDETGRVRFNHCLSQIALHEKYGGVVPELASRSHFDALDEFSELLKKEKINPAEIAGIAATMGPGLVGPLLVGSSFARGLAAAWQKPFIGVHHLRAHIASALLDTGESPQTNMDKGATPLCPSGGSGQRGVAPLSTLQGRARGIFPALVLLVSGGHCMILRADADLQCEVLKNTSDDAAGECFDKCAKLVGLPYPGGPAIEAQAQLCVKAPDVALAQEWAARLPRPKSQEGFSFAGLKTAFRLLVEQDERARKNLPALAKALEISVAESLLLVLGRVAEEYSLHRLICCGGVSANLHLRRELTRWTQQRGWEFFTVPLKYSTDNAVMVAAAAWIQSAHFSEKSVFPRGHL